MADPLLPGKYIVGAATVVAGGTLVTPTNALWSENVWLDDLFFLPSQPLVPPQRIERVEDGKIVLAFPWPGLSATSEPYEVRYVGIVERSTAQSRRVLEQLEDVKAWADIFVQTDADRLALDTPSNPLAAGERVLVVANGVIWQKKTSAYNDWLGPAAFKGDTGNKGWSPVFSAASDGERRVWQLTSWVGGQGAAPAGVGKYVGAAGLVDNIADGVNVRGPAGNLTGVTTFWQNRITADADAAAARAGLGAQASLGFTPLNKAGDSATGVIRTPAMPAFDVSPDTTFATGNGTHRLPMNAIALNVGFTGTLSNARFVCTVAGRYRFTWTPVILADVPETGLFAAVIRKNGSIIREIYSNIVFYRNVVVAQRIVEMAVNDYVEFWVDISGLSGNPYVEAYRSHATAEMIA